MDQDRVLPRHTVLVQHGWITALGPTRQVRVPEGALRIDGRGKFLMPGLGDMHVHLGFSAVNPTAREDLPSDSLRAEHQLFGWLANGVTTIRNVDFLPAQTRLSSGHAVTFAGEHLLRLRARAAAGVLLSPRIYTSGPWAPDAYSRYTKAANALRKQKKTLKMRPDSVAAYVAAYKAAGYDFLKVYPASTPVLEDPEIFDSLSGAARRLGISIVGHSVEGMSVEKIIALGYKSVEHLMYFTEPWMDTPLGTPLRSEAEVDSVIRAKATTTYRAGLWNCPTLAVYVALKLHSMPFRFKATKALQDAGAGLLLGSDAAPALADPAWDAPDLIHRELQTLVTGAGLTPYQALRTGTWNVAAYFGTLDSAGSVAVGKRADLVLLNGNPLEDIRYAELLRGVMIGGRWLARSSIDRRLAEIAAAAVTP